MSSLPKQFNENIIVGYENSDDAGVFRINDETILVQTLDFFTPITDDPELYGRIAAVNSLNDIYAMGGLPLTALSIVCYPQNGDWEVLGQILKGGQAALNEENVVILGGHSVDDKEIKFGYSITGTINAKQIFKNGGAKPGDLLILTKPIGTGIISTGIKFQKAKEKTIEAAIKSMTISAQKASKIMQKVGANACTDITGFGLLGHTFEMAKASKVTLVIDAEKVPLLPDVLELVSAGMLTRGDKNNRDYVADTIAFDIKISKEMQSILFDPQTAGGLLISAEKGKAEEIVEQIDNAKVIGRVTEYKEKLIYVE